MDKNFDNQTCYTYINLFQHASRNSNELISIGGGLQKRKIHKKRKLFANFPCLPGAYFFCEGKQCYTCLALWKHHINLRGVSTKLNKYIIFTIQTYKELMKAMLLPFLLEVIDFPVM